MKFFELFRQARNLAIRIFIFKISLQFNATALKLYSILQLFNIYKYYEFDFETIIEILMKVLLKYDHRYVLGDL